MASSPLDLVNAASKDTGVETTAYTYDANGNQITKVTDEKTETNTYDGLNQLIGFTDGETVANYTYDVDGLRLSKTVDGVTTKHVWDGSQQIIADVVDGQFYEADCYLRGTNLVATYSYENGAKSDYIYYTQNAHGDVVNLTDADGEVVKSYTYDAFGVEKGIDDADTNAFRYCGEYYDAETGTIYLRARYYNPTTGRFISRDSFAGRVSDPLSFNKYTYCHNNPIAFFDPQGLYERKNAVEYAKKYAKSSNKEYLNFDSKIDKLSYYLYANTMLSSDCTNFTSQALVSGGLTMNEEWSYSQKKNECKWYDNLFLGFGCSWTYRDSEAYQKFYGI